MELIEEADVSLPDQGMVDLIVGDVVDYVGDKEARDDIAVI